MARKKAIVENSAAEVKSAIEYEMNDIGPGEIPEEVQEETKEDE